MRLPGALPGKRRVRRGQYGVLQPLEPRLFLSVTQFSVDTESIGPSGGVPAFSWQSTSDPTDSSVELWVDQVVSASHRNSRVLYRPEIELENVTTKDSQTYRFLSTHALPFGNYIAWLREHSADTVSAWKRADFQLDNDGDSLSDLPMVDPPAAATLSVIREGQGFAAHELSESRIAWTSDELLHDVWVNQQQPDGGWAVYRRIRNVPGRSISISDVQSAPQTAGSSFFGQAASESSASLESGDYRFFVRSVNAATDESGQWAGRGRWSAGVDFSYERIEDESARPETITVTHELSPSISWTPVAKAEYYLVSLWKGPNYSAHRPLIFRSHQTYLQPTAGIFRGGDREIVIQPGDEIFVKVRAVGQDGTSEQFTTTNHVSASIQIPAEASVHPTRPVIDGPALHKSGNQALLTWGHVQNAESYEVWMSSVDDAERIFLATDIRSNRFLLSPSALDALLASSPQLSGRIDEHGLKVGRYRFWVRAHSPVFVEQSAWSTAYDFEVVSNSTMEIDLDVEVPLANRPLVAPNLAIPFEDQGRSFLLFSNGKGETFGASVLAKYEVNSDGSLQRPIVDGSEGLGQLEFSDLSMGTNVSDMRLLSDGRIVVLSRGSSEIRIVDPVRWQVDATYSLVKDRASEYPDALGLEVLSNDQIAVVFNRSDRLRIFEIASHGLALEEIDYKGKDSEGGFRLSPGRGVQVSAVQTGDGVYRFFVATPGQAAVVVYDYNAVQRSLMIVSGDTVLIRRSSLANPFHGGTVASIQEQGNATNTDFYFSADRSGFLTWVHPQTLQHGFIDLANWMPSVNRDAESDDYANPNDNSFDTTRILPLDESRLVVLNSRQKSVLLQLVVQPDGQVTVIAGSELPSGYGGASLKQKGDEFIVTTAVAPFSRNRQTSEVALTQLTNENGDDQSAMIPATPITMALANPIVAAGRFHGGLILQRSDGTVQQVRAGSTAAGLETRSLGTRISNQQGNEYVLTTDLFHTFHSEKLEQDFLFVSAVHSSDPFSDSASVLLLLEATEVDGLKFAKAFPIAELEQLQSVSASDSTVVLLDRLHGQMQLIKEWQSEVPQISDMHDFGQQHPTEMGAIRPARSIVLSDESVVVVHDTFPDRGFTVFSDNSVENNSEAVPVFHANTTGTFSFDLHAFDDQRLITASYGGDILVFNIESGVWEADTSANDVAQFATTFAVENSSFGDNKLIINSPSAQTVIAVNVTEKQCGLLLDTIGTHTAIDAITTIADDKGYWIVGTGTVQRVLTAKL